MLADMHQGHLSVIKFNIHAIPGLFDTFDQVGLSVGDQSFQIDPIRLEIFAMLTPGLFCQSSKHLISGKCLFCQAFLDIVLNVNI